jgi:pimeloyl-ACP methyl ester carboxylesterase
MTDVLIFVPGLLGSELWDANGKVWPGSLKDGLFGFDDERFARLCADGLEPRDIVRKAAGIIDIYDCWIQTFERLRSKETGGPLFEERATKPTLIAVPYDWRKPNERAADAVAAALRKAVEDHGDGVQIHLAAHSMGGLVCRYLLQSGQFDGQPGIDKIATLLTFGVPHKGAAGSLAAALGQEKTQFLSTEQTKMIVNDPRFPSVYQLFPQEGTAMVWDAQTDHGLTTLDVFRDPALAASIGLKKGSLDAAARFHDAIRRPWPNVRTFLFVGTRYETPTHFLWDGKSMTLVRTKDGGDGTVTLQGSLIENQQVRFTDKSHVSLINADQTRSALQMLFNADGIYAISPDTVVSISVAELVVENRGQIEIGLAIKGTGKSIEGTLFLERARPSQDAQQVEEADFEVGKREYSSELVYDGPDLTSLHVFLNDVIGPAIFRPVFETKETQPRRSVGPAFVVKAPV